MQQLQNSIALQVISVCQCSFLTKKHLTKSILLSVLVTEVIYSQYTVYNSIFQTLHAGKKTFSKVNMPICVMRSFIFITKHCLKVCVDKWIGGI